MWRIKTILFCVILGLSGCVTAPPKHTSEEHEAALLQLVQAGDENGIRNYFDKNAWCVNADEAFGCGAKPKTLAIARRDFTLDDFLLRIAEARSDLARAIKNCKPTDAQCLARIGVNGPKHVAICSSCEGEAVTVSNARGVNDIVTIYREPENAGRSAWISEKDRQAFLTVFVPAAKASNTAIADNAASSIELKAKQTMGYAELKQAGCVDIGTFTIVQKLGPNSYELAKPNSLHGNGATAFVMKGQHAVLDTRGSGFTSGGYIPYGFYAKPSGARSVPLKNGFSDKWPVLVEASECKIIWQKYFGKPGA